MKKLLISSMLFLFTGCNLGNNTTTDTTSSNHVQQKEESSNESNTFNNNLKLNYVHGSTDISGLPQYLKLLMRSAVAIKDAGVMCSGVMIDEDTIKTAAHCLGRSRFTENKTITVFEIANTYKQKDELNLIASVEPNPEFVKNGCMYIENKSEALKQKCQRYDEATIKFKTFLKWGLPLSKEVNQNPIPTTLVNTLGIPISGNILFASGLESTTETINFVNEPLGYGFDYHIEAKINPLYKTLDVWSPAEAIAASIGDSGGPIYVCSISFRPCALIGILSAVSNSNTQFLSAYARLNTEI